MSFMKTDKRKTGVCVCVCERVGESVTFRIKTEAHAADRQMVARTHVLFML